MLWGASFLLPHPAGTLSPGPALPPHSPHGCFPGAAPAPLLEPRVSRDEEEEIGTEQQREVGQGGGVAGEGKEQDRGMVGTRRDLQGMEKGNLW